MAQSKGLPGSCTIKRTSGKCHYRNNCQGVLQSKGLPGSATIKRTAGECDNPKNCQGVLQSKGLLVSDTIKRTAMYFTITRTARKCYNKKKCQGELQSKELPVSGIIKRTARGDTIIRTATECYKRILQELSLYPRHLCRRVYSFRLSVCPFVRSYVRMFVRNSVTFVEFASKFCVKVSQVVYIAATTYQKAFIFGP